MALWICPDFENTTCKGVTSHNFATAAFISNSESEISTFPIAFPEIAEAISTPHEEIIAEQNNETYEDYFVWLLSEVAGKIVKVWWMRVELAICIVA